MDTVRDLIEINEDVLCNLEKLALDASPGTWTYFPKPKYGAHHVSIPVPNRTFKIPLFEDGCRTERPEQDAKFIAAANPETILSVVRYAKHAKSALEAKAPDAMNCLVKQLMRALSEADSSLREVMCNGGQYDASDIDETLSIIRCAVELAKEVVG